MAAGRAYSVAVPGPVSAELHAIYVGEQEVWRGTEAPEIDIDERGRFSIRPSSAPLGRHLIGKSVLIVEEL